ncbi:MAG: hypothetical protein ACRDL1_10650 [Solirubrobacterales bacterium]
MVPFSRRDDSGDRAKEYAQEPRNLDLRLDVVYIVLLVSLGVMSIRKGHCCG